MNNEDKKLKCKHFIIPSFSVVLIVSGLVSYFLGQYEINVNIKKNEILQPGSNGFNYWYNPPASILRKFYFFNVMNPIEVENGTSKPILEQRGPFVYKEIWEKKNVEFINKNLMRYYPTSTLVFAPEYSNGSETDEVTILNVPALGFLQSASTSKIPDFDAVVNEIIKLTKTSLFMKKTVKELISGYKDPLLELAHLVYPNLVQTNIFSFLNGENGTMYENFTVMTGADDVSNVGQIVSWNGMESLPFWKDEYANMLNGSDGSLFPPFRSKDERLYAYNRDMCRSYHLVFYRENTFKNVKVYDFHLPENIFANSTVNPENSGFCTDDCLGNGVFYIGPCYGGAAAYISLPHYLNAEERFINDVSGIKPDEEKHDFLLHFEPTTGVPIAGNIRLQINFFVNNSEKININKNVKPVLLPVIWFDDAVELNDSTVNELSKVAFYVKLINIMVIVMLSLGGFMFVTSVSYLVYRSKKNRKLNSLNINGCSIQNERTSLLSHNS